MWSRSGVPHLAGSAIGHAGAPVATQVEVGGAGAAVAAPGGQQAQVAAAPIVGLAGVVRHCGKKRGDALELWLWSLRGANLLSQEGAEARHGLGLPLDPAGLLPPSASPVGVSAAQRYPDTPWPRPHYPRPVTTPSPAAPRAFWATPILSQATPTLRPHPLYRATPTLSLALPTPFLAAPRPARRAAASGDCP